VSLPSQITATDERLRQATLCRRQWTDEYVDSRTSRDVDEAERSRRLEQDAVPFCTSLCKTLYEVLELALK